MLFGKPKANVFFFKETFNADDSAVIVQSFKKFPPGVISSLTANMEAPGGTLVLATELDALVDRVAAHA